MTRPKTAAIRRAGSKNSGPNRYVISMRVLFPRSSATPKLPRPQRMIVAERRKRPSPTTTFAPSLGCNAFKTGSLRCSGLPIAVAERRVSLWAMSAQTTDQPARRPIGVDECEVSSKGGAVVARKAGGGSSTLAEPTARAVSGGRTGAVSGGRRRRRACPVTAARHRQGRATLP